jgi:hypothetical protein
MEATSELEMEVVEDNPIEAQATCCLQEIKDDVQERMEVALPGLSEDKVRVNELRMVQSLYKDSSISPGW